MGKSAAVNVKKGEISNFLAIYLSAGNFIFTEEKLVAEKKATNGEISSRKSQKRGNQQDHGPGKSAP